MDRNSERHAGMLDPSFGEQGKAFPDTEGVANGVTVNPASHVFLAGRREKDYMIIQLQSDGKTDPSFGQNGIVTGKFQKGFDSGGASVTLTNDGRILLTGRYTKPGDEGTPALARHHQDGSLDTSFGDQGTVVIRYPIKPYETDTQSAQVDGQSRPVDTDKALSLPDGKILVVSTRVFDYYNFVGVLARLNPDGSFDESFNDGKGFTVVKYQNYSTQLSTFLQQPDGNIIVAGIASMPNGSSALVARINADGTLDTHFGESGFFLIRASEERSTWIQTLALQSNGSIIAAGFLGGDGIPLRCMLLGLTASGTFDPLFNKGQPLITQEDEHQLGSQWLCVATQPDSKIVVQGNTFGGAESDVILRRYSALGEPDLDFGDQTGLVRTEVGDFVDMGSSMTLDGTRIVVAGTYIKDANNVDFRPFALRYLA
ncbi:hypothetical protein ACQKP7_04530 [Pseudomonas frederiksbergensis]|uniref:hypothetical protein n=1 Tax=Pseudomonas frederiksbergensis TaxID=104087 RepID=UPI003D05F915